MGKGRLLTNPSLSPADIQLLANSIIQYVDEGVRYEHEQGHTWHTPGHPDFFDGHRQFIGKLDGPTASAFSGDPILDRWHVSVHVAVGGVMVAAEVSPCAAIFWPWHAYIDDIYEEWLTAQLQRVVSVSPLEGTPSIFASTILGRLQEFHFTPPG